MIATDSLIISERYKQRLTLKRCVLCDDTL